MADEPRAIDPTANPDEGVKYNENGEIINEVPSNISEETMADILNIWSVFAEDRNEVSVSELKTIMRALDVNVSSDEILEDIEKMIDPDGKGSFTLESLKLVMEEQLKEKDTIEDLIEQLKKLDKDNDGRIPAPEFKQYMTNLGLKMKQEDLDELMKVADPKGEGVIEIADFADSLCPPKK